MPMFTSCYPGWVRFLKSQYPDIAEQLSTAKSPQQMFGATAKTRLAYRLGAMRKNSQHFDHALYGEKSECELPGMDMVGASPDVDLVLTTRELARIIRAERLEPPTLTASPSQIAEMEIYKAKLIPLPARQCIPQSPHTS